MPSTHRKWPIVVAWFIFVAWIILFFTFLLYPPETKAAGPELVEVISIRHIVELVCPATVIGPCTNVPKYAVTFRRNNGTSGDIVLTSWTTAKELLINFCPGKQGQLEKPCPQ